MPSNGNKPPNDTEKQFLKDSKTDEFHFLAKQGLSIHDSKDREEGRGIIEGVIEKDKKEQSWTGDGEAAGTEDKGVSSEEGKQASSSSAESGRQRDATAASGANGQGGQGDGADGVDGDGDQEDSEDEEDSYTVEYYDDEDDFDDLLEDGGADGYDTCEDDSDWFGDD